MQIAGNRVVVSWVLSALVVASCETKPREVYEIPTGYRGWVEIRAERAGCRPLPRSQGETRFVIAMDGTMCTSSPVQFGWSHDSFYYVKDGKRLRLLDSGDSPDTMIWQKEYYGSSGVGPRHERDRDRIRFFVGTKTEYEVARNVP